jgi:hypothetical protein
MLKEPVVAEAIRQLIVNRIKVDDPYGKLRDHPTIQVTDLGEGVTEVGFLGLLNGIVGVFSDGPREGWGLIAAETPEKNPLGEEGSLIRFLRTSPS